MKVAKSKIVVTNACVYGKTYFSRRIDLPLNSISSVGLRWFNTIVVSTASGKILFPFISNSTEIHQTIRDLLVKRQNIEPNIGLTDSKLKKSTT